MAFDFNNKKSSGGVGGFQPGNSRPGQKESMFRTPPTVNAPFHSAPPSRAAGFQNAPGKRSGAQQQWTPVQREKNNPARWKKQPVHRQAFRERPVNNIAIPWRLIFILVAVVTLVALCVLYRDAITAFIAQLFAWAIAIILLIFLVKVFIFGGFGRKRR